MKLTEYQLEALSRLAKADAVDLVLQARGRLRVSCARLVELGFAEKLANDNWTGAIFKITDAGRQAAKH